MKTHYYIGYNGIDGARVLFTSSDTPTPRAYPAYAAVIGPFRTKSGARFMLWHGQNNPHCRCVADAERIAKKYQ